MTLFHYERSGHWVPFDVDMDAGFSDPVGDRRAILAKYNDLVHAHHVVLGERDALKAEVAALKRQLEKRRWLRR